MLRLVPMLAYVLGLIAAAPASAATGLAGWWHLNEGTGKRQLKPLLGPVTTRGFARTIPAAARAGAEAHARDVGLSGAYCGCGSCCC
jgi:hypothetical protein